MQQLVQQSRLTPATAPRPLSPHRVAKGSYLARQGADSGTCSVLVTGLAHRSKVVVRGCRQILGICVPGDMIDLSRILLDHIDHNVQAMTECEVIFVPRDRLKSAALHNPSAARELWTRTFIETAIAREWQANIGRRNAATRMAHLICELRHRLSPGAPKSPETFELPLTQTDLADVLGLTPVHVNRVLRELEERGLIERRKRHVTVPCWPTLCRAADFDPSYLFGVQHSARPTSWIEILSQADAED